MGSTEAIATDLPLRNPRNVLQMSGAVLAVATVACPSQVIACILKDRAAVLRTQVDMLRLNTVHETLHVLEPKVMFHLNLGNNRGDSSPLSVFLFLIWNGTEPWSQSVMSGGHVIYGD